MGRFSREVVVTEKVDGTNAQIYIGADGEFLTGTRTRWITPQDDNFGFSRWAHDHKDELMQLGPGRHFGEWFGSGINRSYGLPSGVRRFAMFNVIRWCMHGQTPQEIPTGDPRKVKMQDVLPACVELVPILWRGKMDDLDADEIVQLLRVTGSHIVPGYLNPEGIVIFHTAGNVGFKKTIEHDEMPKSAIRG